MNHCRAFLLLVFSLSLLCGLGGCAGVSDSELNPTVVRIATGQAVLRYVDAADNAVEREERKVALESVFNKSLADIDSGQKILPGDVVRAFTDSVDWGQLSLADRQLAIEGIALIESSLNKRTASGELPEHSLLYLRGIVASALDYLKYM